MSVREINGWIKYLAVEPSNSIEIQLALISQQISSALGSKKQYALKDFLITQYAGKPKPKTPPTKHQILSVFQGIG